MWPLGFVHGKNISLKTFIIKMCEKDVHIFLKISLFSLTKFQYFSKKIYLKIDTNKEGQTLRLILDFANSAGLLLNSLCLRRFYLLTD